MSFENYFAVHSNKCYLVAHYLQLGLEHPWFGNSCLCYSIGHHGSERRHASEHCAFHSVWQDEIADHFLQRLRYVMRSRDMSQPTQCALNWGNAKIWTTKILLKTLDRVKNKSHTQCPSKNRGAFFSLHFPSPDHWTLVSVVLINREESRTLCWFSSLFLHWKGWIYLEISWVVRPGIFRMVGRRSRILLGFSQFWVCLNCWTLL